MHLGFIGLGHLGRAVAGRLLECGHTLSVYNRTPQRAEGLAVDLCDHPRDVIEKCDVVLLCLFDSTAVNAVLSGENGLLGASASGKTVIDLTTNHFDAVAGFHERCRLAGAAYLECPVLGSVVPAANGALTVLASGEEEVFERSRSILESIGAHLFYLRKPGRATKMKLVNNLALGGIMAVLAETVGIGEAAGIERETLLEILAVGGGKSLVLDAKRQKLLDDDFTPHFSNALIYKDLHCLQDLAYGLEQPLYTAGMVKELYARTFAEGFSGEDFASVAKLFRKHEG
ncbi:NAD(P)-dependent oxidoreductase [Sulfurimonas sp. ST-25]|uniref:NAD(P)-dependent oxidoreductase n=1 Tax=Sulfurimonas sp. ST-25 TaxID=3400151 RepID=UPI003A8B1849